MNKKKNQHEKVKKWVIFGIVLLIGILIWVLKDILLLLISVLLIGILYFSDNIFQTIEQHRIQKKYSEIPLQSNYIINCSWELLHHLKEHLNIRFPIEQDIFLQDAVEHIEYADLGATTIIRITIMLNAELGENEVMTAVSQSYVKQQKSTPLGSQNPLLQRLMLESVSEEEGFLKFVFHDSKFYRPADIFEKESLDDDYYA